MQSNVQGIRKSGQIADACSSQIVVKIGGFTTKVLVSFSCFRHNFIKVFPQFPNFRSVKHDCKTIGCKNSIVPKANLPIHIAISVAIRI